jgi:CRISPR/Cas system-associated protein endoribonuclease Cas2
MRNRPSSFRKFILKQTLCVRVVSVYLKSLSHFETFRSKYSRQLNIRRMELNIRTEPIFFFVSHYINVSFVDARLQSIMANDDLVTLTCKFEQSL